jgi:2-oxo-4-hydroxy-4-carboxy--5-ureidoimidazoline (OHCU) decarboxylase
MPKKMSSVQYKKIRREDIMDFVNELYECQNHYIELAVEASNYKDAKEVLQYIMEKK